MADHYGRTLKTGRQILHVLRLLEEQPGGLTAAEVAGVLGRSTSTATNLLNTLVAEGFANHDRRTAVYRATRSATPAEVPVDEAVGELYGRTGERAYFASFDVDAITVERSHGRQGLPYVPNLQPRIRGEAHALAVGKAILAHVGDDALDCYIAEHGLRRYTPRTTTDPSHLRAELAAVRRDGVAVDREEYATGHCCLAAPLLDERGALIGAVALSLPTARFSPAAGKLADVVLRVAREAVGAPVHAPPPQHAPGPSGIQANARRLVAGAEYR